MAVRIFLGQSLLVTLNRIKPLMPSLALFSISSNVEHLLNDCLRSRRQFFFSCDGVEMGFGEDLLSLTIKITGLKSASL